MAERGHEVADAQQAETWSTLRERTSPAAFLAAVADQLAAAVTPGRPVLDVGAGAGQLSAALAQRGVAVVASDLSVPMVELVDPAIARLAADATALPHPDGAAGAVLAAHVLHVVPDWRGAVAELDRVAGPDGVVLVHVAASSAATAVQGQLKQAFAAKLPPEALKGNGVAANPTVLDEAFAARGRAGHDLPELRAERTETVRGLVAWMEGNPWTWPGPTTARQRALGARAALLWAAQERLDPDEPLPATSISRWRRYDRR